jgi:dsDNA-specific endonuclease/ATPase MutS2
LDELGGGTDPVAGAYLAQAILETLLSNPNFKIVATTHSPELKALSLTDGRFHSACVTLDALSISADTNYSRKPTYQLIYGTTGESYALGAASRCCPRLPIDVIQRAAQLMSKKDDSGDVLRNHLEALDREVFAANNARQESERIQRELILIKHDTLIKLQSSAMYLSRLESRLEAIFQTLSNDDTKNAYDLVGGSLDELKLVRKKLKTEEEMLAEKGLRRVPENYRFYNGETVVIIAEGAFNGYNGVVKVVEEPEISLQSQRTVTVVPTLDLFSINEEEEPPLQLKRSDVAIWDYPDTFGYEYTSKPSKSSSSSAKVMSLLSTLNVDNKTAKSNENDKSSEAFTSSRQRKASKKGKRKK